MFGWYVPPYCGDCQSILHAEAERRQQEAMFRDLVGKANLPPRFQQATFATFHPKRNPSIEHAWQIAKAYAERFGKDTTDGLCFIGSAGCGKTHLACAIAVTVMRRWVEANTPHSVRFITAPALLQAIRASFAHEAQLRSEEVIDRYAETRLLIVDDLGAEKPSEWVRETVFVIMDRRYGNLRPTIFTTNYTLTELRDRLGERIVSRMAEMCRLVKITNGDYRLTQQRHGKPIDSVLSPQRL